MSTVDERLEWYLEERGLIDGAKFTPEQREVLGYDGRTLLVAGGERAGKSFVSSFFLVRDWARKRLEHVTGFKGRPSDGDRSLHRGSLLYWIMAADYELARPEFVYCQDYFSALGALRPDARTLSMPTNGRWRMALQDGTFIETRTADDVKKVAARAPDGIILAEAAQLPYEAYLKAVGRVSEKRGWLVASSTFEGSLGWFPEAWEEWRKGTEDGEKSFSVPSWSNLNVYPGGRTDPEILRLEAEYSKVPGLFEERCGAVPVPPSGLVFRDFRMTHHMRPGVQFTPALPVYLAVDPSGTVNPYAVLACQFEMVAGYNRVKVVDTIYEVGRITEDVIKMARHRVWWKYVRGGAVDVESPDDLIRWNRALRADGVEGTLISDKWPRIAWVRKCQALLADLPDGLPALLVNSKEGQCLYDESRMFKWGDRTPADGRAWPQAPPRGQPDHAWSALGYLALQEFGYTEIADAKPIVIQPALSHFASGSIQQAKLPFEFRE